MSDRRDADMEAEMRLHVELLADQNRAAGMPPAEARRAALLRFGPGEAIREAARAQRRWAWLGDLGRDVAYAARTLRRDRVFTLAAVLAVALGVGAATAVFSVVDGVLLRPLPYRDADRLAVLKLTNPPRFPELIVLPAPFVAWRRGARAFDGLAAVRTRPYSLLASDGGGATRAVGARQTANTFSLLGVRPALGRDFVAGEDVAGKGQVAILSHGLWQRRFGGRASAVGSIIDLDGQPFQIVGVMPRGFALDAPVDLYTPAAYEPGDPDNRRSLGRHAVEVFGRLRAGVTLAEAQAEIAVLTAGVFAQSSPGSWRWGATAISMREARVGPVRPVRMALLGAVAFLMLIACANLASLTLARAHARAREIAVRAALGAAPGRIARQLLTESGLVALLGGAAGLVLAGAGTSALLAAAPADLPRAAEIAVDVRAGLFACALALLAGIAAGLAPVWGAPRARLADALKEGGRGGSGRARVRQALVVAQVAVALVLLAGAGLLIRTFANMQQVPRGFEARDILTFELSLSDARYPQDRQRAEVAERLSDRLAAAPGVVAVGAAQALPFSVDQNLIYFQIAGHAAPAEWPITYVFEVTPGYFTAMGIPLRRGRRFDARDRAGAPSVVIINETLARRYFPGEDPVGRRMGKPGTPPEVWAEIVGVVADVRDGRVFDLGTRAVAQIYVPYAQDPYIALAFVVRSVPEAGADLPAAIRGAIAGVDRDQAITAIRPLADLAAEPLARQRFAMMLFAVFAAVALALAAGGIHGVIAYTVARRRGEIGIRMALGARAADVRRLVLREGARLFAIGGALGLLGALLLTRLLGALLFGVTPYDPLTFAAVLALLAVLAALACVLPAQQAARVDPMTALRAE